MTERAQDEALWDYLQSKRRLKLGQGNPRQDLIARQIARRLHKRDSTIVETGFGNGYLLHKLEKIGYTNLTGIDISSKNIKISKEKLPNVKFKLIEGNKIPFEDSSVDCFIASEVIEHMSDEDLGTFIDELHRVLKPGGIFVGSVPAHEDIEAVQLFCPNCEHKFHKYGHKQSFDKTRIRELFNKFHELYLAYYFNRHTGGLFGSLAGYAMYAGRHIVHRIKRIKGAGFLFVFKK